jgi:2-oxoacid:acceptor oxidoreductase gamma subunit (pyruvate/2-ketoisovalerate family)
MIEIRIHGRGGQGAVVASEILATAFFLEGKSVQTFPEFGVERRGAPVAAYLRVDNKPVRIRCRITEPDHIIVLDPVLLSQINVTSGLKDKAWVLVNSNKKPNELGIPDKFRVATVDATKIAITRGLGPRTSPIVNTAILGAFCRLGMVSLKSLEAALIKILKAKAPKNLEATREAYNIVVYEK